MSSSLGVVGKPLRIGPAALHQAILGDVMEGQRRSETGVQTAEPSDVTPLTTGRFSTTQPVARHPTRTSDLWHVRSPPTPLEPRTQRDTR